MSASAHPPPTAGDTGRSRSRYSDTAPTGATVLVVEDDERIAAMLAKGLSRRGYVVETVAGGADALERLAQGGIDVELLDLGLPDIDGLEVLRLQRERGIDVPLIVVTARSDPRDRARAFELGAGEYVMKPFAWTVLWDAVERCLRPGTGLT